MNYFPPTNPSIFPTNFNINIIPTNLRPNPQSLSNNSTSDEGDERKQRRMISNRESARRSRMRKQRQLDELWSQLLRLRTDNTRLIEKMNEMSESHDRVVEENAKLKEEAAQLRTKLMINVEPAANSFSIFEDLQDFSCNVTQSSNHSITTSDELTLH